MRALPKILLLSCYELGRQPLSLARPAAVLREAGFDVLMRDLSVQALSPADAADVLLVAVSAPMHTAVRLAVAAARQLRAAHPRLHICLFGLYAWQNRAYLLGDDGGAPIADSIMAGEAEEALLTLARALATGTPIAGLPGVCTRAQGALPVLRRLRLPVPDRAGLPPLDQYARYMAGGVARPAGYTETSRGCLHTCRHCPVTAVYGGRFFVVAAESVLEDIRRQVACGASHITFGDPDFLNGPGHVLRIARAMHAEFPRLTFDFTTKVEHILHYAQLLPELHTLGARLVISAFEATADPVLARLEKGHTVADMDRALALLAAAHIAVQPTWLPFTPWTSLDDYLAMLAWIRQRGLAAAIPPVQLSIRLLIPPDSALLVYRDEPWWGPLDAPNFSYTWTHPDPRMDELQQQVAAAVERLADEPLRAFYAVERLACEAAGRPIPAPRPAALLKPEPPRLTEDWFC